jgi:hypothetical protein
VDIISRYRNSSFERNRKPGRFNPYRHVEEIVPEEIRTLPTFPYNEDCTERWCYRCKIFQDVADFRKNYGSCKQSLKLSPDQRRNSNYRQNYGITLSDYNQMFEAQGGRCAACLRTEIKCDPRTKTARNLCIDHDHITGQVRGLLCSECNTALGLLQEKPSRAKALIGYMKKIQTKSPQLHYWQPQLFDATCTELV